MADQPIPFQVDESGAFFHGTKVELRVGDLLEPGRESNYGARSTANFVYLTRTLDAATWGAELAAGDGPGRIYRVEPTGPIEDDPNLTDQKFPGNPTRSYRTRHPLRVVGEVLDWQGHSPELLQRCGTTSRRPGASASRRSTTDARSGARSTTSPDRRAPCARTIEAWTHNLERCRSVPSTRCSSGVPRCCCGSAASPC